MLDDSYFYFVKSQRDFPLLQNREIHTFKCHKETLTGYLYEVENPHGLIITAHGINTLADSNHALYQNYFVEQGWDVFAFDEVGCGRSTGKGMVSLAESRYCVDSAISYVRSVDKIKDLPICLFGHSWGSYGVVTASGENDDIKAVTAFSGYDAPNEIMFSFAMNYASPLLGFTKPILDMSLYTMFGNQAFYTASGVIKRNNDTKYLIIHGDLDDVIPLKGYSIYTHVVNKNYPNVDTILLEGFKHTKPWTTQASFDYLDEVVFPGYYSLEREYEGNIPEEVLNSYIDSIDFDLANQLDLTLMNRINTLFLDSVS